MYVTHQVVQAFLFDAFQTVGFRQALEQRHG
jgi:hypothetical protein